MKKLKYFIPSICLMILIFWFSHQTGSESSGLSSTIVLWIENNLHISIPELVIRKGAHMSEYALLTFTLIYGYYHCMTSIKAVLTFSLCSTFIYACSDELHQLFISGRAGQFSDVLIDTSGGIMAVIFFYMIYKYKKNKVYS